MTESSVLAGLLDTAAEHGGRQAFTFLDGDGAHQCTYAGLRTRITQVAARLTELGVRGERIVIAAPTSVEYVPVFFGCMLAGAVPVPVYMPALDQFTSVWTKIASIARDAGAVHGIVPDRSGMVEQPVTVPGFRGWLDFADLLTGPSAGDWPLPAPDDLAFLQYTSGSTGHPKGVMVTQAGLAHNSVAVRDAIGAGQDSTFVSWLPLYHDMGIVGSLIAPLYWGAHVVTMTPHSFAADPARWLRAIGDYRGHVAYTPNFGLELCIRKVTDAELAELDLSSWRALIDASEPVREHTLRRFTERFRAAGFAADGLRLAYGLAESTLVVTMSDRRAVRTEVPLAGRTYLGCGTPIDGMSVRIVDPDTHVAREDGEPGEIWVAGPSVAAGYWQRPDLTEDTFHARVPGDPAHYLRTGDIGVRCGDEVAIVGRRKDIVIVNGVNHYPQDVEHTVELVSTDVRAGRCAAFATEPTGDVPQSEAAVVVAEVRDDRTADLAELVTGIRLAVARDHDLVLDGVFLVAGQQVPRTTSGKIQRRASREMLLASGFTVLASWVSPALPDLAPAVTTA